MSETALRDRETSSAGAWLMRSLPSPHRGPGAPEPAQQAHLDETLPAPQELERTVARALERATALEAQVAAAQTRADLAERRADEAEEWLARLHDAVVEGFTRRAPADEANPAKVGTP
jgi:hypothetical protein